MAKQLSEQNGKIILDYALKYFEIHAAQRMSVFNFFIVLSGIIITGLATCIVGDRTYAPIGVVLGILLTALAWTFWKLDQRTSFLVKRAEHALERIEQDHFPPFAHIIGMEATEFAALNADLSLPKKRWTYSKSLGIVFAVVAIVGLTGAGLSFIRATNFVQWLEKPDRQEQTKIRVEIVERDAAPAKQQMSEIEREQRKPIRDRPSQTPH